MEGSSSATQTPQVWMHITSDELWAEAQRTGSYSHPTLAAEGFIHGSTDVPVKSRVDGKVQPPPFLPFLL